MVKFNDQVSSSRRKQRRAHFSSDSAARRERMAAPLNSELRAKHGVRSLPVRKDDEVLIIRGDHKGREGKVVQVYRKKWAIYVDKVTREKANGTTVQIPVNASKVVLTKLRLDRARKASIERKSKAKGTSTKGKHSEGSVSTMSTVD